MRKSRKDIVVVLGFVVLGMVLSIRIHAQEHAKYTQYMFNKSIVNPAYGGLDGTLSLYAQYRSQWSGLENSPKTFLLNGHIPIYRLKGAIGFVLKNEKIGFQKDQSAILSYNYIYQSKNSLFSMGSYAGYRQLQIDGNRLRTPFGEYQTGIDHKDPLLLNSNYNGYGLIWGVGGVYVNRFLEVSLAVSNLGFSKLRNKEYETYTSPEINLIFQYNYYLSKGFVIKPMAMVVTDLVETSIHLSSVIEYYGKIFAGIIVQMNNNVNISSFGITTGAQINQNIKLYYSYDIGLSRLKALHDGSHEIVLNYNLNKIIGKGGNLPIIYSPRNL